MMTELKPWTPWEKKGLDSLNATRPLLKTEVDSLLQRMVGFKFPIFIESLNHRTFEGDRGKGLGERLKNARIFIFEQNLDKIAEELVLGSRYEGIPDVTSLPFETCYFEIKEFRAICNCGPDGVLMALLAHEEKPGHIISTGMMIHPENPPDKMLSFCTWDNKEAISNILKLIDISLRQSKLGTEKTQERFKIGTGPNKYVHKIKSIIRVSPKNTNEALAQPVMGKSIDWSHRWEVRGHWRRIEGIGKNRVGDYSVMGFTWVKDHAKGPEDKILIKKTRVVT